MLLHVLTGCYSLTSCAYAELEWTFEAQVSACKHVLLAAADHLKPQRNSLAAISQRHNVAPIVNLAAAFACQLITSWSVDEVAAAIDAEQADLLMEAFNAFLNAAVADNDTNLTNAILSCLADAYGWVVGLVCFELRF